MKIRIATLIPALVLTVVPILWSQDQGAGRAALQQRVADLKQSMAANRAKLMKYQWTQTVQVTFKGNTKRDETSMCHYGPDGKVVKTPTSPPPAPPEQKGGLRGKIVAKKVDEMKDYVARLKSLISHYAPPQPEMIQAAVSAGNTSLTPANGTVALTFTNYYKQGDKVTFDFDTATKKLVSYDVNTYLDDPKTDIVTMKNTFATLPDGANYLAVTVLDAPGKQLQVIATNSDYTPISS